MIVVGAKQYQLITMSRKINVTFDINILLLIAMVNREPKIGYTPIGPHQKVGTKRSHSWVPSMGTGAGGKVEQTPNALPATLVFVRLSTGPFSCLLFFHEHLTVGVEVSSLYHVYVFECGS